MSFKPSDITGHADECPGCHRDTSGPFDLLAEHCPDCGTSLINRCTACGNRCPPSAAFCARCGKETEYRRLGFV